MSTLAQEHLARPCCCSNRRHSRISHDGTDAGKGPERVSAPETAAAERGQPESVHAHVRRREKDGVSGFGFRLRFPYRLPTVTPPKRSLDIYVLRVLPPPGFWFSFVLSFVTANAQSSSLSSHDTRHATPLHLTLPTPLLSHSSLTGHAACVLNL